jgi:hypothetical protein
MRSFEEIEKEIAKLEEIKPKIKHYSFFGDDHWASIDAQVQVLTEQMTDTDVYDEWEDVDDWDANRNIIDDALVASEWLHDDARKLGSLVSEGTWLSLVEEGK